MADVSGAVVSLVFLLPAGQQSKHMQGLERPVSSRPGPLQAAADIDDPGVRMLADILEDGEP